ncbi:hypothetical protein BY458DRAFT_562728 [Sporodiniella umbellata]|nr:hypothetical protein BY458DRAFT_562728 [Sporodiniella umbellata]
MSFYSKNLFDVLAVKDNAPVKADVSNPIQVSQKKNVSKVKETAKDTLNPADPDTFDTETTVSAEPHREKIIVDTKQRFQENSPNDFHKNGRRDNKSHKSNKSNSVSVNLQDAAAFTSLSATT